MTNKILAAGSVALMGAGSLLGASAANAYTVADCGEHVDALVTLLDGNICDVRWFSNGEAEFTAPDGVTAVEAILVGAGDSAVSYFSGGYFEGYAGHAGEVVFLDDVDPDATHELVIGIGANAGRTEMLDEWTDVEIYSEATDTVLDGTFVAQAGNGSNSLVGDGAKGTPNTYSGYLSSDPDLVGADNPLWPVMDGETPMGEGGQYFEFESDMYGVTLGTGASWSRESAGGYQEDGGDGAAIFRFFAPNLAATGVDANAIGMTAGALGLGGVALAVVAAARRTRRSK